MSIPKIIHYCWFGGNPLPKSAKKYIKTWKKYFPDYEIKEWNESNYDVNKILYTQQAYEAKKYAFVSDYARFDILYNYGGVYFDTDVEVIKPFDDILKNCAFMGCESDGDTAHDRKIAVAPGLGLAANPGLGIYKEILDAYSSYRFYNDDGTYNTTTVVKYTTDILVKHGLRDVKEIQNVDGITIYPREYFCPKSWRTGLINATENTYTIHHFDASWAPGTFHQQRRSDWKTAKRDNDLGKFKEKFYKFRHSVIALIIGENNILKLKRLIKK